MPQLQIDTLRFTFDANVAAEKYDEWNCYIASIQNRSLQAVDVVAPRMQDVPNTVWFIEAKDFRAIRGVPKDSNLSRLAESVSKKVRDTIEGLAIASGDAQANARERQHARRSLAAQTRRIVLHLEPYTGPKTKLFPTGFTAGVLQKLKQLVRDLDRNPLVLKIENTHRAAVPWTVA